MYSCSKRASFRSSLLMMTALAGCTGVPLPDTEPVEETAMIIETFDAATLPALVSGSNATLELLPSNTGNLLDVHFQTGEHLGAGITLEPEAPWDWSEYDDFGLAMEIGNPGPESVQLHLNVEEESGAFFTRSVVIPAQSKNTYYAEVAGADLKIDSGLRDNPPNWQMEGTKFIWMWGTKELDTSRIARVRLSTDSLTSDRTIQIDDVRLILNPDRDADYLTAIVDEFGQSSKSESKYLISSVEELHGLAEAESDRLDDQLLPDRSTYGGWKDGPQFEATGYFRTAKHDGKWSFVDPQGYLFFSTGIANVRMSNTSTITGMDVPHGMMVERSADDLTPEDSIGLNPAPRAAQAEAFIESDLRRGMFTWLPSYDDPLANHYGYRRELHTGPVKRGETYSFYRANLERKFGEGEPESFMDDWRELTILRMRNWGFTSFGNWLDPSFYDNQRTPYFANGWIIGNFKTVSSGDDFWSPIPDPFDPVFEQRAVATVQQIASEVKGSEWCIGVFIDNEKSWGRMGTPEGQYGIVINTLPLNGDESPAKRAFTDVMRTQYETIEAFNAAWSLDLASWEAFDAGFDVTEHTDARQQDYAILLRHFAAKYFQTVHDALAAEMPNHLYMGARFASWGMTPEIRDAAAQYADVMSYNEYREHPHPEKWGLLEELDMPSIIGEFHFGALDTGMFHPGLIMASDQADRAEKFKAYMHSVIDNPYFVGAHWFQYIDSPITGRAYDGENYNVGFVSVADVPYPEMVEAARELNTELYTRRFK